MSAARASWRSLLPSAADYAGLGTSWRFDLTAGLTVGIVALPLALAFGVSSGAGAAAGLITAIVAGVVAAIFGGSNVQVSGPTGAMAVILAPILATHGLGALALLCLLSGVVLIVAGALRLGRAITLIPWPVIEGFTLGLAFVILAQQVPGATGTEPGPSASAVVAAVQAVSTATWPKLGWSLALVALVIVFMLVLPKLHPALPASLIAIIIAGVLVAVLQLPVDTIGQLPHGLPAPALPVLEWSTLGALIGPAFAIAVLAGIESLLSARVASTLAPTGAYDPDRELVGQGVATIAAGFFGGMPANGAIVRTAVNARAGARTRVASITHGLLLLLAVVAGASVVESIPTAALAGVLIVTALRMISVSTARTILGTTRADAIVFVVTAIITVSVDLISAVGIGVAAAAFFALRQLARSSRASREAVPEPNEPGDDRIAVLRIDGALFFGAAERMLEEIGPLDDVDVAIIRMAGVQMLDATGAQVVSELITALERSGVTVLVKGIQPRHMDLARRVGVIDSLRHQNHLFDSLDPAIEHARSHIRRLRASSASDPGASDPVI